VGLFPYVYVAFAGKVRCFDGETGQLLWEVADVHKGGVSALCVSHNQRFFMTGGVEGSVSLLFHIYTCVSHCFLVRMCFVKCVVYMYIYAVLYYGRLEGSVSLLLSYIYMRFVIFFCTYVFVKCVVHKYICVCVCVCVHFYMTGGVEGSVGLLFFHMYVCVS